jgi:hypothetical protein
MKELEESSERLEQIQASQNENSALREDIRTLVLLLERLLDAAGSNLIFAGGGQPGANEVGGIGGQDDSRAMDPSSGKSWSFRQQLNSKHCLCKFLRCVCTPNAEVGP